MDRLENKLLDSIDVDYQRLYLQIIMRCVVIYNDNNDRHNSVILLVRSLDQHVIHIRMVEYFNMYDVTSSYTIKYNMSLKLLATTMFVALFIYLDLDDNIDRLYSIIEIISYISSNCLAYDTVFISAYKHVISNIYNTINEMNCIHEELIEIVSNNKLILLTSSKPTPLVVLGNRDRSYHFDKYLYQTNISKIVYNLLYTRDISYNKDQVIRTTMSTKNRMNNSSGYKKQHMMISDHSFSKLNNRRRNQTDNSMLINDTKYTSDKYSSSNASTNQYQIQPSSDTKDLNQSTKSRYKHQMHITKRSVSSSQDNLNESRSNFNKNTIKNKRSTSHGYTFENENSPYMRYDSLNRSNSNVNNKSYNNMSIHKRQIDNITIQFNKYLLHHKENTSILFNNNNTINISNCIYNDIIGNLKATGNQRHHTQNEERITDDDINDTTLKTETKPNKIEDLQQVERQYVKMKKNKEYWVSYLKNKKRSNIYNYHIQGNGKQDDELLSNDTIYNNIHNRNLSLSRANMANLSSSHISLNGKMNNSINKGSRIHYQ